MLVDKKDIKLFAKEVAKQLYELMGDRHQAEYCTVKEAADILGISADHMRKIKDRYPYIKNGSKQQGHILFKKSELLKEYAK